MILTNTKLIGAFVIELQRIEDERGYFSRSWCKTEFEANGLDTDFVQCNISFNKKKNTLRGMHYQAFPHEETKIVRCTRGSIYDVIVDLRSQSHTYKEWFAVELNEKNQKMLYIPKGFAHGFLTLEDETEVSYQMSASYYPQSQRGFLWNDATFQIEWPTQATETELIISVKDQAYERFSE
jgi:dTDP-4-dehydrorhamnose 3,5-epimerase